jgi:hypothetical protein
MLAVARTRMYLHRRPGVMVEQQVVVPNFVL